MICRIIRKLQPIIPLKFAPSHPPYLKFNCLYKNVYQFATPKKHKDNQSKSKAYKTYNLEGIDESKIPEHLKDSYRIRKETYNLQVPS